MIIKRYLLKEIAVNFTGILSILILILISSRFVSYLSDAVAGEISSESILQLLVLKMISSLELLLPLCLFFAILMALGRLRRDNELTTIIAAGLGRGFFLRQMFKLALLVAIPVSVLSLYLAPWASMRVIEIEARAEQESDITGITAGRFKEFSQGDRVIYVESMKDRNRVMENVFLQVRQNEQLGVLTSDTARMEVNQDSHDRFVIFEDGQRYTGIPGTLNYTITHYEKYGVRIREQEGVIDHIKLKARPTKLLWDTFDSQGKAELQWRISMPVTVVILAWLAVILAPAHPDRGGRYSGLLTAILLYFTYSNLLGVCRNLVKKGDLSAWIGLWWVHLLMVLLMVLIVNYPRLRRWRATRKGPAGALA